jgi:hypothetical protein
MAELDAVHAAARAAAQALAEAGRRGDVGAAGVASRLLGHRLVAYDAARRGARVSGFLSGGPSWSKLKLPAGANPE